jgi:hypothetical protein
MTIASQYVSQLPVGTLDIVLIVALVTVIVVGKIALQLINRYL